MSIESRATKTGFFVTTGGEILEMDIPSGDGHAAERHQDALDRGDLAPISADLVEEYVASVVMSRDGSPVEYRKLRRKAPAPAEPKRAPVKPKPAEKVE